MFTLVIFPGFNPELWAERAPVQDSRWVPHRRAHTNNSHCPCTGGCRNAVTLLPFPHHHDDYYYPRLYFHPTQNLPQNEWAVLSFSSRLNKCCPPLTPSRNTQQNVLWQWLKKFSSLHIFQGALPPQLSFFSIICCDKVLPLSPVVEYTRLTIT